MIDARSTLEEILHLGASDIFVEAGLPLTYRAGGALRHLNDIRLKPEDTKEFVDALYLLAEGRPESRLLEHGDDDFSFHLEGVARFRVSAFRQKGSLSAVLRVIRFVLPTPEELKIPPEVMALSALPKGLIFITGPAGSGKTTTLSCLVDEINRTRSLHIVTLEDPIEYLHMPQKSVVSQREIITDTDSFLTGLTQALRQSSDVIVISELNGSEMVSLCMKAAESGRLVFACLHTPDPQNTLERVIGAFQPAAQDEAAARLSEVLKAVVSQDLLLTEDGFLKPRFTLVTIDEEKKEMIKRREIRK